MDLIIKFVKQNPNCSSTAIFEGIGKKKSLATVKRILSKLIQEKLVLSTGKGKATRYQLSPFYTLFEQIDVVKYYEKEIDDRQIKENFNFSLITDVLPKVTLFSEAETEKLTSLQKK